MVDSKLLQTEMNYWAADLTMQRHPRILMPNRTYLRNIQRLRAPIDSRPMQAAGLVLELHLQTITEKHMPCENSHS